MARRKYALICLVVTALLITGMVGGTALAEKSAEVAGGVFTEEDSKQAERELKAWEKAVRDQVKGKLKDGESMTLIEVGSDATEIVGIEFVDPADDVYMGEEDLKKGSRFVAVYLDNGEVHTVGPFDKKPTAELIDVDVPGSTTKTLVVK